jgi:hypothetical protein
MACDTHRKTIGRSKVVLLIWSLFGDPHYLPAQILTIISKLEIADGACVEATQPAMEVA